MSASLVLSWLADATHSSFVVLRGLGEMEYRSSVSHAVRTRGKSCSIRELYTIGSKVKEMHEHGGTLIL